MKINNLADNELKFRISGVTQEKFAMLENKLLNEKM